MKKYLAILLTVILGCHPARPPVTAYVPDRPPASGHTYGVGSAPVTYVTGTGYWHSTAGVLDIPANAGFAITPTGNGLWHSTGGGLDAAAYHGTAGQVLFTDASGAATTWGGVTGDATNSPSTPGLLTLATVNGSPGTFGSSSLIPVVTVNGKGLVTSITTASVGGSAITAITGDGTATGPGSVPLTLATVNGNVGTFGSASLIPSFTVNAKGLITAASTNSLSSAGLPTIALTGDVTGSASAGSIATTVTAISGSSPISITPNSLQWLSIATGPTLSQATRSVNFVNGSALTVQAQNETGTSSTGGDLDLTSGTGTTASGAVNLQVGGVTRASIASAGTLTLSAYGLGLLHSSSGGAIASSGVVNGDLTSGSFTNITGVGALSAGSLAAGFSVVTVPLGGTNLATLTAHAAILGEGTSSVAFAAPGASGTVLVSGGASSDPTFGTMTNSSLAAGTFSNITGVGALAAGSLAAGFTTVNPAQGGTGLATLTAHNVLLGEGTSSVAFAAPGSTAGFFLRSNGSGDPSFQAGPTWTSETFCASGCTGTSGGGFTCPPVGTLLVCGAGGGGGGGAGGLGSTLANGASGGGAGGGGSEASCAQIACTPGDTIIANLGSGGSGASSSSTSGNPGGNTTMTDGATVLAQWEGAAGGGAGYTEAAGTSVLVYAVGGPPVQRNVSGSAGQVNSAFYPSAPGQGGTGGYAGPVASTGTGSVTTATDGNDGLFFAHAQFGQTTNAGGLHGATGTVSGSNFGGSGGGGGGGGGLGGLGGTGAPGGNGGTTTGGNGGSCSAGSGIGSGGGGGGGGGVGSVTGGSPSVGCNGSAGGIYVSWYQ